MPAGYIALQILLAALAAAVSVALARRPIAANLWGLFVFAVVVLGLAVDRISDWSWKAMELMRSPTLVFWVNVSLAGATALAALMVARASGAGGRARAAFLGLCMIAAAAWSYSWFYLPVPLNARAVVNRAGYCPQTTPYTCSAASAAMLLHHYGIDATEREMAIACLTRIPRGTTPLGLYYGVSSLAQTRGLAVRVATGLTTSRLPVPCIIEIGIKSSDPPDVVTRLEHYGWIPKVHHDVYVGATDPHGEWIDVLDPVDGPERWPTGGMEYIWNGDAMTLTRPGQ